MEENSRKETTLSPSVLSSKLMNADAGPDILDNAASPAQVLSAVRALILDLVTRLVDSGELLELPMGLGGSLSLTGRGGRHAERYVRVFIALDKVHQLLMQGVTVTQRDLYYQLKGPLFPAPRDVNSAMQALVSLLRVPRARLQVQAASRGALAGSVSLFDTAAGAWRDLARLRGASWQIPTDMDQLRELQFRGEPRFILVIEKDAVFHRLCEDSLAEVVPTVLLTARGMPDLATRIVLARLAAAFPAAAVVGLADWNPSGVTILRQYKGKRSTRRGGTGIALEASEYAVPSLAWLGIRAGHLGIERRATAAAAAAAGGPAADAGPAPPLPDVHIPPAVAPMLQDLTPRDRAMIRTLVLDLELHSPSWAAELKLMESVGKKAEAEAGYLAAGGHREFTKVISDALVFGAWI